MKIFVIGAGGFIGSSILDHLLNSGHTVEGHIRSEAGNLTETSLPADVDVFVNAAGKLGVSGVDTAELTNSNSTLPVLLADFCDDHQIHLIHLSTPGVSGLHSDVKEDAPYDPWGEYEKTKADGEILLLKHPLNLKNMITILRPDFVYGPGDMHKLELFNQVQKGWFPVIGLHGASIRPTYCADVCRAVETSLPGGCLSGGLYNIGGPEVLKFRDFILKTALSMDIKLKILPIPRLFFHLALKLGPLCPGKLSESKYKLFGTDHYVSISRAMETGFYPECDIKKGISKTVSWYRENGILP
ncbi:MAG: NAD(P)-dependent oxidoreductase [Candidatus Aegiribacteria sp.]|nr:NAD(P)-dependent oxidoreductase [Candidatus Aegiribacteria sp.]